MLTKLVLIKKICYLKKCIEFLNKKSKVNHSFKIVKITLIYNKYKKVN